MQTNFADAQRQDPAIREAESILRACVHCGFCTATCPTYVLLGDELDSPRGRIYLIKDMLENDKPASESVVRHLDRCLSCLSCMTTCPSGVDYMHLVDQARVRIEATYTRPLPDRTLRWLLRQVMPYTARFRAMMRFGKLGRPFAALMPGRLSAMLRSVPSRLPPIPEDNRPGVFPAQGPRRMRVALLAGCVQPALAPEINAATIRLLTRHGAEVVIAEASGCCGALSHHMGHEDEAKRFARANIQAWMQEIRRGGLDAIVVNASGCGTTVKDYGHMFADDPDLAGAARQISALAKDVSELCRDLDLAPQATTADVTVAYHSACSLQHGQGVKTLPRHLLEDAGFHVREPVEAHICCGSAGTYSLLQPELSTRLQARKAANLERLEADCVATGNIGCMMQIEAATRLPVVHTVELLDWATGGPKPAKLDGNHVH